MDYSNEKSERVMEVLLWSIAFPGFGQLLNRQYIKGMTFIFFEVIINVKGNVNAVIIYSFLFKTAQAIAETNYEWVLFYPCFYIFAIWDAYKEAGGGGRFSYISFACSAFIGTLGVIYSSVFTCFGIFFGPIWLGISGFIIGALIGKIFEKLMMNRNREHA